MRFLVIHGPNLNLLGMRDPDIYGSDSLADLNVWIERQFESESHEFRFLQFNGEGDIIDCLQEEYHWADGIVLNAGGYTHTSIAIRDTVEAIPTPTVEVHLSDIYARESFRKLSYLKDVCIFQITGLGKQGYFKAIQFLVNYLQ